LPGTVLSRTGPQRTTGNVTDEIERLVAARGEQSHRDAVHLAAHAEFPMESMILGIAADIGNQCVLGGGAVRLLVAADAGALPALLRQVDVRHAAMRVFAPHRHLRVIEPFRLQ